MQLEALFTVGQNAIIVNDVNPDSVANAVVFLIQNGDMYTRIQQAGRATVLRRFDSHLQSTLYTSLYIYLSDFHKSSNSDKIKY